MNDIVLYYSPRACSRVTMTALEEAGAEYEARPVSLARREHRSPEFLKINPAGKVPALLFDGRLVAENAAILLFLDSIFPHATLFPKHSTPMSRAEIHSDLFWISSTVHPTVRQMRMPVRFTDGDTSGVVAKGREYLNGIMKAIDARLRNNDYWYGVDWSVFDAYLCWAYTTASAAGYPIEEFPAIRRHSERVEARPSHRRAVAREQALKV